MRTCFDSPDCGLKINRSQLFSSVIRASPPYAEKALSSHAQNSSNSGHNSGSFWGPKQALQEENAEKDTPGSSWGVGASGG